MKIGFDNSAVNDAIRRRPELRFNLTKQHGSPTMMQSGLGEGSPETNGFMNNQIASSSKSFKAMRFMLNRIGG